MKAIGTLLFFALLSLGIFMVYAVRKDIEDGRTFLATCTAAGGDRVERKRDGPRECWNTGNGRRIFPNKEITP